MSADIIDPAMALYERWAASYNERKNADVYTEEGNRKWEQICDDEEAAVERLRRISATTIEGVIAKLRVALQEIDDGHCLSTGDSHTELIRTVIRDLERMAAGAQ